MGQETRLVRSTVPLPALLGEVADTHRLAPVDGAAVRGELPGKEVQQGRLSRPVAPQDAHVDTGDEVHAQVIEDQTASGLHAVGLGHVAQADHCVTLRRT